MAASKSDKGTGKARMHPGDEARPCKGSGQVNNKPCPDCGGTGKVTEGIGGA